MSDDLKPCPFCGGTVVWVASLSGGLVEVTCGTFSPGSGCGARGGLSPNIAQAREKWNRRPSTAWPAS